MPSSDPVAIQAHASSQLLLGPKSLPAPAWDTGARQRQAFEGSSQRAEHNPGSGTQAIRRAHQNQGSGGDPGEARAAHYGCTAAAASPQRIA